MNPDKKQLPGQYWPIVIAAALLCMVAGALVGDRVAGSAAIGGIVGLAFYVISEVRTYRTWKRG